MHLFNLVEAPSCGVEEVKFIEISHYLVTFFGCFILSQDQGSLCQFQKIVFFFKLFGSIKSHINISTSNCKIESLFQVLFEEESNLRVSLLFQVADYTMTTEISLT